MSTYIRDNVAALHAYTPGEQPSDPAVVKLNTNENPYPPAPAVLDVLQRAPSDWFRLYPDPVALRLRESIARVHGCAVENVFCGNGSDEVLALCIRAFVPNHGRIGYFDPSYSLYPVLAAIADVGTAPLSLNEDFSWPVPEQTYDVPLFFWTNPNAPTSLLCPQDRIAAFADRSEGVVVVDEAYAEFAEQNALALALDRANVLVTRSFSKSYSLAGARLGYAIGDVSLIEALYKIKDAYNIDRLTQEVGRAAIEDQAYMQHNVTRIRTTRERVKQQLEQRGFFVYPSQANFLWIRPPADLAADDLFNALRDQKIYVRYFPAERTKHHLRVTIGTDQQMDAFLGALPA